MKIQLSKRGSLLLHGRLSDLSNRKATLPKDQAMTHKRRVLTTILFSSFFSLLLVFQSKINYSGSIFQRYHKGIFRPFSVKDLVLFVFLFMGWSVFLGTLYYVISRRIKKRMSTERKQIHRSKICIFWGVTFFSFVIGVLFLLTSYPGTLVADSWSSIYQYLGMWKLNNHHPILFTALVGLFLNIGRAMGDYNVGIFLFSIFQIAIMSVTEGYITSWLYTKCNSMLVAGITAAYFLFNNIFYTYAIMIQKDTLFSVCIILLSIRLEKGNWNNNFNRWKMLLLLFAVAFLRNNGLIIDWLIFFAMICFGREIFPVKLVRDTLIVLLVFSVVQGPIFNILKLQTETVESLGVPIQQIGYVIADDGELSKRESEFLDKLLPLERWKEQYAPFYVDSTKNNGMNNEYLSQNIMMFLKTWMGIMRRNVMRYIKAYALQTYGFWSLGTHNDYGFADNTAPLKGASGTGIYRRNILYEATGVGFSRFKEVCFPDAGTLFWVFSGCIYLMLMQGREKYIIIYLPVLFLWITVMLATPVAFSLRYVFAFAIGLPCFVFYPFIQID